MGSWWTKIATRWASVQRAGKDDETQPRQQVLYHGKVADCVMLFPYGMHANVDGQSLGVFYAMGGDPGDRAGMFTSMTRRSQLAGGDVEVYSPVSRSRVTFRANGDVEVDAKVNLVATVTGNVSLTGGGNITGTAGGNVDITAGGTSSVSSTAHTINAPTTVTDTLTATGLITGSGFKAGSLTGVSGTFTTADAKTVTVTNGIITNIV